MRDLDQAIKVIKQGGIVIFPTDTAFGIGCRIDDEKAIPRLFKICKRPNNMAAPVLFDSIDRVKNYVLPFGSEIESLMKNYWPGALTIVLPCEISKVPNLVRGGGNTLGVRIPDHNIPLSLVKGANIPIIGSSANFHGGKTPYKFSDLDKSLLKLVDFVIEGKTKGGGVTSTVLDCSVFPWKIIRQGKTVLDL